MNSIQNNSMVSIHYRLTLEDGTLVEDSHGEEPLVFSMGDETLSAGMEALLLGKKIGDKVNGSIPPELGYGYPEEENIHIFPAEDFPDHIQPEAGQVIAFDGPDDEEIYGTVVDINDYQVKVDFSHPLAGRSLVFDAEVVDIITPQES